MASRTTTRRTSAAAAATGRSTTGDNGGGRKTTTPATKLAAVPATTPAADEKIPAIIEIAEVLVPYYRPVVHLGSGEVLRCEHKYAHESKKSAGACGRQMERSGAVAKSSGGSSPLPEVEAPKQP